MRLQVISALGAIAFLIPSCTGARAADYSEGFAMPAPYVPAQYYGGEDGPGPYGGPYGGGGGGGYDDEDRYDRPDYYRPPEPQPVYRSFISCWRGSRILQRQGFYNVRMSDCEAPVYQYRVMRDGRRFLVRMSARTGRVLTVIRLRAY